MIAEPYGPSAVQTTTRYLIATRAMAAKARHEAADFVTHSRLILTVRDGCSRPSAGMDKGGEITAFSLVLNAAQAIIVSLQFLRRTWSP